MDESLKEKLKIFKLKQKISISSMILVGLKYSAYIQ